MRRRLLTSGMVAAVLLTGCSGPSTPEVTPAPAEEQKTRAAEAPTPTPSAEAEVQEEAERGSRANPLAPGEARRLSAESAWTLSAGPTDVNEGYLVLPLTVGIDWESIRAQAEAAGEDPEAPMDPSWSLTVKFVSAAGKTYDEYDYEATVADHWFDVGELYPPLETITANVPISVPAEAVEGGVWSIENMAGDRVFIAQS